MPAIRQFNAKDVENLLNNNANHLGERNAALIMSGVGWGLNPLEMCQVSTKNLISESGELYRIWVLPEHNSYNGEAREIRTENNLLPFFESYIDLRIRKKWGLSNLHSYKGLDPESKFLLNDYGRPYKLTKTHNKDTGKTSYQARSMNEQLKRIISRTNIVDAKPSSFRDSYIKALYDEGAGWEELKLATGLKNKKTLERKIRPEVKEMEDVYKSLFRGVKLPKFIT